MSSPGGSDTAIAGWVSVADLDLGPTILPLLLPQFLTTALHLSRPSG